MLHEWGEGMSNLSSKFKMIRLLKAGSTVGVCLQQPRQAGSSEKKSLETQMTFLLGPVLSDALHVDRDKVKASSIHLPLT